MDKQSTLTSEQWQSHVAAWNASGDTQSEYCKAHGLLAKSFWYWKRKFSDSPAPSAEVTPVSFLPLTVIDEKPVPPISKESANIVSPPVASGISVHIGNTYRIDLMPGFDAATLRQALSILQD